MKITEVIILAGGLGTRLRSAVPELPKCMAPVNARPFISFVIDHCLQQGIERFIFSLGYKHEIITQYLNTQYATISADCVLETEPLGTGGAIRLACSKATADTVLVLNGDTLFKTDVTELAAFHSSKNADCSIVLKPMTDFDRYGAVSIADDNRILNFTEKTWMKKGNINGGVYALNTQKFLVESFPEKFSFEKDYLSAHTDRLKLYGNVQDEYFIDIGIPEDFERAQLELRHPSFP